MSTESHLKELERKHQTLDVQISEEERRPGGNSLEIRVLKKQKLKLKEEIERRRAEVA